MLPSRLPTSSPDLKLLHLSLPDVLRGLPKFQCRWIALSAIIAHPILLNAGFVIANADCTEFIPPSPFFIIHPPIHVATTVVTSLTLDLLAPISSTYVLTRDSRSRRDFPRSYPQVLDIC